LEKSGQNTALHCEELELIDEVYLNLELSGQATTSLLVRIEYFGVRELLDCL
jgi:hypothetical protein